MQASCRYHLTHLLCRTSVQYIPVHLYTANAFWLFSPQQFFKCLQAVFPTTKHLSNAFRLFSPQQSIFLMPSGCSPHNKVSYLLGSCTSSSVMVHGCTTDHLLHNAQQTLAHTLSTQTQTYIKIHACPADHPLHRAHSHHPTPPHFICLSVSCSSPLLAECKTIPALTSSGCQHHARCPVVGGHVLKHVTTA